MNYLGFILSLIFIVVVAFLLIKKFQPHAVLIIVGLIMLFLASMIQMELPKLNQPTGFLGFDYFKFIKEAFSKINAEIGLMIMTIGGFVAYVNHIEASKTLVFLASKPLKVFKSKPYLAASLVIPIGQLLFVAIPSAAGLSLLLMASLFPILVNLGVSKVSAASVITAATAIGIGPVSATTVSASSIINMDLTAYFVNHQIKLILPLSLVLMIAYYFVNKHYDKKEGLIKEEETTEDAPISRPYIYAILPILPIVLLISFSDLISIWPVKITLDATTAMFISLFVALFFELIRLKSLILVFDSLTVFWDGMGNIFKTVVTLIIAAEIFAKGLISLGFIKGLLDLSQNFGFNAIAIGVLMTLIIYFSSMLMGSGNASFFSFGPLVPEISEKLKVEGVTMILPMEFSASMGRTISPVAGVIIAVANIAGITTFQIVKRNFIPLTLTLIVMLIYHFL